jgi:hypothetical protein
MSWAKAILAIGNLFLAAATVLGLGWASEKPTLIPDPIFREDLHPFGYPQKRPHQSLADYTDLAFLSDDLILVSLNERTFTESVEPLNTDKPSSTLLLFNISQKTLVRSYVRTIEKFMGSVRATHDGHYVLLDQSGIRVCSENLECGPSSPITGDGPTYVSPRGLRIMAGGNRQNEQKLLDADSLKILDRFTFGQAAMPGDTAVLTTREHQLCLLRDDGTNKLLSFPGGIGLKATFLSDEIFATYKNDRTLLGVDLNSTIKYRISILPEWSGTDLVPAASGTRFCIHQNAYHVWGSKLSVSNEHRTRDVDIYRVFQSQSGKEIFHFEWDPRPYINTLVAPAISPSGHRLAVIHSGYLEVFELP